MSKATEAWRDRLARYWAVFRSGGPVGLGQVLRHDHVQRKIQQVYDWLDREEKTHEEQMQALRAHLNYWVGQACAVSVAREHFNRYVGKTNPPQPKFTLKAKPARIPHPIPWNTHAANDEGALTIRPGSQP